MQILESAVELLCITGAAPATCRYRWRCRFEERDDNGGVGGGAVGVVVLGTQKGPWERFRDVITKNHRILHLSGQNPSSVNGAMRFLNSSRLIQFLPADSCLAGSGSVGGFLAFALVFRAKCRSQLTIVVDWILTTGINWSCVGFWPGHCSVDLRSKGSSTCSSPQSIYFHLHFTVLCFWQAVGCEVLGNRAVKPVRFFTCLRPDRPLITPVKC
jgi:hypothetical protein